MLPYSAMTDFPDAIVKLGWKNGLSPPDCISLWKFYALLCYDAATDPMRSRVLHPGHVEVNGQVRRLRPRDMRSRNGRLAKYKG